jgi:hypothetical protein
MKVGPAAVSARRGRFVGSEPLRDKDRETMMKRPAAAAKSV